MGNPVLKLVIEEKYFAGSFSLIVFLVIFGSCRAFAIRPVLTPWPLPPPQEDLIFPLPLS